MTYKVTRAAAVAAAAGVNVIVSPYLKTLNFDDCAVSVVQGVSCLNETELPCCRYFPVASKLNANAVSKTFSS